MLLYEIVGGIFLLSLLIPLYTWTFPGANLAPRGNDVWWLLLLGSVFTVLSVLIQSRRILRRKS